VHTLEFQEERWSDGQAKSVSSTTQCIPFFASYHLRHAPPPLQTAFVHAQFSGEEGHRSPTEGRAGAQFTDLVANPKICVNKSAAALTKVT
jgi:hypothetical protein